MMRYSAVCIGVFDGVHLGHQAIIKQMTRYAKRKGYRGIVVTIDPHPSTVLNNSSIELISTLSQRIRSFKKLGADEVEVIPFTRRFSKLKADLFVKEWLLSKFKAKAIFVGESFRFGFNASGDRHLLERYSKEGFFETVRIGEPVYRGKTIISSTMIRGFINSGNIALANELLFEKYNIMGTVQKGAGRGRIMGYPTINISSKGVILPKNGVYAGQVQCEENSSQKTYWAAIHIGPKPTFRAKQRVVEAHILTDNKVELYGKEVMVRPMRRIRDVKTFNTVVDLKKQICKDVQKVRAMSKTQKRK